MKAILLFLLTGIISISCVIAQPVITAFTPPVGGAGSKIAILGSNFTDVTSVSFGGTPAASFTILSPTSINAVVSTGTSGEIKVTSPSGVATVPGFTYLIPVVIPPLPTINSFSPVKGPAGTTVTLTGLNFDAVIANNIVYFGATRATVTAASTTQLKVTVPAGATYKPISVTTRNITGYSIIPFLPTFSTDSATLTSSLYYRAIVYSTPFGSSSIYVKDLNDDGKPELIISDRNTNSISVLLNTTSGGTLSFAPRIAYPVGNSPYKLAVDDLDGDGKPDIAVVNINSGLASTVSVLRNSGSGNSLGFDPVKDFAVGNGSTGIAIQDINEDGKPDIVTTSSNVNSTAILLNSSTSPGLLSFNRTPYAGFNPPHDVTIADLDNDGKPEWVETNLISNAVSVPRNTSFKGNLSSDLRQDFSAGNFPSYITSGDLDGDGKVDLAVANYLDSTISLFRNQSSPGVISLAGKTDYKVYASNIAIADLNGDGKPDLATGGYNSQGISLFQNNSLASGGFLFGSRIAYPTGDLRSYVEVADLDGDGKPEIVASTGIGAVYIYKQRGREPVIRSLSRVSATSGTTVTLTGANFSGTTSVTFGGVAARSFAVISPERIDAVVGGGATGLITVTSPAGTGFYSDGFVFVVSVSPTGPLTICDGESVLLTSSADANNEWYLNGSILSGATGKTFAARVSGNYSVRNTNGVTVTASAPVAVTVITTTTPVISQSADGLLVSSATTGNQWFINGEVIPGAVNQQYQPVRNANYTVTSTQNGCTSPASSPFAYNRLGTTLNLGNNQYLSVFPNPVVDKLNLSSTITGTSTMDIRITNQFGKQVLEIRGMRTDKAVNIAKLPPGIYFVNVQNAQLKIDRTIKVVKR